CAAKNDFEQALVGIELVAPAIVVQRRSNFAFAVIAMAARAGCVVKRTPFHQRLLVLVIRVLHGLERGFDSRCVASFFTAFRQIKRLPGDGVDQNLSRSGWTRHGTCYRDSADNVLPSLQLHDCLPLYLISWVKTQAPAMECLPLARRSEERRVGKECRSRWARGQGKETRK